MHPSPSDPPADSVPTLAQARTRILGMFRTRRELSRWDAVSDYVNAAFAGTGELRFAADTWGSAALIPTTEKALASVAKVALHADDSNGEIGGLAHELLALHAELCNDEPPKPAMLVEWLINIRFDGSQDFWEPDIAAYTDALGSRGLFLLGERLAALEAALPPKTEDWDSPRSMIGHYRERAAVASGDPDAVIAGFGELTRSYRMHDLAKALVEVGDIDEAIGYAERATMLEEGHQAERAGQYWCELLHEEWPHEDELAARQLVFIRWPTSRNALDLAHVANDENSAVTWNSLAEAVYAQLEARHPRELIHTLLGLGLVDRAWTAAERLTTDPGLWTVLVSAREKTDPASVVPALIRLIDTDLQVAKPQNYKSAVKRLKQLRRALKATDAAARFPLIVAGLRDQYRRRPTLLQAFDRAGF